MRRIRYHSAQLIVSSALCLMILFSCVFSFAQAENAATPTDLQEAAVPFEQTETVDGLRFTARREAAAPGAAIRIAGLTPPACPWNPENGTLTKRLLFSVSGLETLGESAFTVDRLDFGLFRSVCPEGKIRLSMTRYSLSDTQLEKPLGTVSVQPDYATGILSFTLRESGIYDLLITVTLPEKDESEIPETAAPDSPEESSAPPVAEAEEVPAAEAEELPAAESVELPAAETVELPVTEPAEEAEPLPELPEPAEEPAPLPEPVPELPALPGSESLSYASAEGALTLSPDPAETAVFTAGEEDSVKAFVARCYQLILFRQPDDHGLADWSDRLKSKSATAAQVVLGFLNSDEFRSRQKTPEELVEIMYRTMLDRASDEGGRLSWIRQVSGGMNMSQLVNGFSGSLEFSRLCQQFGIESGSVAVSPAEEPAAYSKKLREFVTRCYRITLDRDPDPVGFSHWCTLLATKQITFESAVAGFVFSQEMEDKHLSNEDFVKALYRVYMGREADPQGLGDWTNILNAGAGRLEVASGFATSAEFKSIIASFDPDTNPVYSHILMNGDTSLTLKNGSVTQTQLSPDLGFTADELTWISSDPNIFTVDGEGNLFGVYPGYAVLSILRPDGSRLADLSVQVRANYRAVLFSESTFGTVIRRNRGDVKLMETMLSSVTGPDDGSYVSWSYDDLDPPEVFDRIEQHLVAPSRDGDVSLFFFASHGDYRERSQKLAGRLWCKNKKTWIELPDLAQRLSKAKGKVIVILESCGPGAAVHDFGDDNSVQGVFISRTPDDDFNAAIISAFQSADPGLSVYETSPVSPEALADGSWIFSAPGREEGRFQSVPSFRQEKFLVLTASDYLQTSYMIGEHTYNLFPYWLTKGVGTAGIMPADTECGNSDGLLTLNELYKYVYKKTRHKQTPKVYPENSDYILFTR